jgi:hypothetical protein
VNRILLLVVATSFLVRPGAAIERGIAERSAVINFADLARRAAQSSAGSVNQMRRAVHRPLRRNQTSASPLIELSASAEPAGGLATNPSPIAATNFLALSDDGTSIPPDTMGAVGPDHIVTMLNSQVRIHSRTGATVSSMSLNTFWSSVGNPDVFDPRITYDPFNNRWIASAAADNSLPSAAILVGVSQDSDPTGNWFLFRVDVDSRGVDWADFDNLGFNERWIVVSANLFAVHGHGFHGVAFWAFDKVDLYANGSGNFTRLISSNDSAFAVVPATTYDNSLDTMYLVEDWDGSVGQLRISTIAGAVGSETLTIGTAFATTTNRWAYVGAVDNTAPQLGSTRGIDLGDSRLLNLQYRSGSLWCAQGVFLPYPAGTRGAAQWWQITPDGAVQQFGRVDEPTGTLHFGYPTIAADASDDALIGYSRFSATQYASANYSYRFATDPPGVMRGDTVFKIGEGPYYSADKDGFNRWGDFSATVIDPLNDTSLWTIQEFAGTPAGDPTKNGSGRWGTWWARIDAEPPKIALARPTDQMSYPVGATVTLTAIGLDPDVTFTNVEFFADGMEIGNANAEPFTITWTDASVGSHILNARGTSTTGAQFTSASASIFIGDSASPVGTWETKLAGSTKGLAYITFNDDSTISGYGIALGTFGLVSFTGDWARTSSHRLVGTVNGNSFTGKAKAGAKLQLMAGALKLSGAPAASVPDITGTWVDVKTSEALSFTPSATFTNVFELPAGLAIVGARGAIDLITTNNVPRSLAGKVKQGVFILKGSNEAGNSSNLKLVRQ